MVVVSFEKNRAELDNRDLEKVICVLNFLFILKEVPYIKIYRKQTLT